MRLGDDLHRFMNWDGPILTDSGGYQVFSLAASRQITDQAVTFRSHIDGRLLELTPERAIVIQDHLGSDIAMCLDECPPGDAPPERLRTTVQRTLLWAERCRAAHRRTPQFSRRAGRKDFIPWKAVMPARSAAAPHVIRSDLW